jgi:hypothetical protein
MTLPGELLGPNRARFDADPFGYSALAWTRWAIAQNLAGINVDPEKPPSSADLKSPVLWLTHAHALSEAAAKVVRGEPSLEHWASPDIPDTFDSVEEDIGGVRWNARDMPRSSSVRQ